MYNIKLSYFPLFVFAQEPNLSTLRSDFLVKNKRKRFPALLVAAGVLTASATSMTSSAGTAVRDASGDGQIYLNDAITTNFYLAGMYNPSSVKSFDFDGNGIISAMDSMKIQHYLVGNIDESKLPAPVGKDSNPTATTRTYMRHDCSSDPASYSEYSLTVDPYDNTVSNTGISTYNYPGIMGDNDMVKDDDTAVVLMSAYNDGEIMGEGSAFIVNDHIIATAAHCIYDYENDTFYKSYYVELKDSNNITKRVKAKYVDICKDFSTCGNKYNNNHIKYDYALMYVEEDLSEYGAFQMGVALNSYAYEHGEVTVSGFPIPIYYPDEYKDAPLHIQLKSSGNLTRSNNTNVFYDADVGTGHSGGPVYATEEFTINSQTSPKRYSSKTVIAINVGIYPKDLENIGLKITPDILKFYNKNPNIEY